MPRAVALEPLSDERVPIPASGLVIVGSERLETPGRGCQGGSRLGLFGVPCVQPEETPQGLGRLQLKMDTENGINAPPALKAAVVRDEPVG